MRTPAVTQKSGVEGITTRAACCLPVMQGHIRPVLEEFSHGRHKLQINTKRHFGGEQKFLFFPGCIWKMSAMLEITHVSLLQAALFLALGVLFSLISIPLVIYDWACSSSNGEGH